MKNQPINIIEEVRQFSKILPHFPDGRIDYSDSNIAAVVNIYVFCGEELLILKRSDKVRTYGGMWDIVGGYFDELMEPEEKAKIELREELGITDDDIGELSVADTLVYEDRDITKTWVIALIIVKLKHKPEIKLDWEHTDYKWINPKDIDKYEHTKGMDLILRSKVISDTNTRIVCE